MSLQKILEVCESLTINDHKFAGQMLSRNMRLSTSEILTVQPFMFAMKPMSYLLYSKNRDLLSVLREADRVTEQYLNFGSTGWLNYIQYRGEMTEAEINAVTVSPLSANKTIQLDNLPAISSTALIVRTGDFVQVGRYAYIATADVVRGAGSSVNVPVHRSLIAPVSSSIPAVIGQFGTTVSLGGSTYTGITFPVVLREYPTYTLVPMTNDSFIGWDGQFAAMEQVL